MAINPLCQQFFVLQQLLLLRLLGVQWQTSLARITNLILVGISHWITTVTLSRNEFGQQNLIENMRKHDKI